jgi:hypothetical protein
MASAFRDELEAARSRADALREQNEELREELDRFRRATVKSSAQATPEPGPAEDPELAKLAERTLEQLEHLNGEVDASPQRPRPANDDADASPQAEQRQQPRPPPHPPRPTEAEHAGAERVRLQPARDEGFTRELAEPDRPLMSTAIEAELKDLRRLRKRESDWITAVFLVGIVVGIALDSLLR